MHQPLVWVDLEMTGLDVDTDVILEIAVILTDGDLGSEVVGPELVVSASTEQLDGMPEVVALMHARSGLRDRVEASTLTVAEAERQVLDFIKAHIPERGIAPLAGNSIHMDRAFLIKYMPTLADHLHYRLVDVSTIKELARRWMPEQLNAAPSKKGDHRALTDIHESIEELRYYRSTIFAQVQPPQ